MVSFLRLWESSTVEKPITEDDKTVLLPISTEYSETKSGKGEDDISSLWCYCNQPSYGNMIMYDNKTCTIQWFHFDCL